MARPSPSPPCTRVDVESAWRKRSNTKGSASARIPTPVSATRASAQPQRLRKLTVLTSSGRVNFTASTIDAKTGAIELRAEFPNADLRWLPGQFVKVRILAGEQTAMRVPQAAVSQGEQSRQVMVVSAEGKAAPRAVQTGSWVGTDMIITGGLKEGEQVIVDNLVKVRPGTAVKPTNG